MQLETLAARIRERREARGLRQTDVAAQLEVRPQAVSKWERAENAPDIALLPGLAELLGVSIDWLLGAFDEQREVFEATVCATTVLGYAQQSRARPLAELAAWVNALLYPLTETLTRFHAVPIKQLGEGVLCFFSGPDHAARAAEAARMSLRTMSEPMGIGLATGTIYLGKIGHPEHAQLDILGDPVNTAMVTLGWLSQQGRPGVMASLATAEALGWAREALATEPVRLDGWAGEVQLVDISS